MSGSPLLCSPESKEQLEARNAATMLEYVAYLVNLGVHRVQVSHLLELQRIAVQDIYPCGGSFRDAKFDAQDDPNSPTGLRITGSHHQPPRAALISVFVQEMLDVCNDQSLDPRDRAGYALWRTNWIHPFAGGNGRVARALTYLMFCFDFGVMLPGSTTMVGVMERTRDRYLRVLQTVDREVRLLDGDPVSADPKMHFLRPVSRYVTATLFIQLLSAGPRI